MALKFWWLGLVLLVVLVAFALAWALRGRPSAGVGALVAGTDAIRSTPRFAVLTRRFLVASTVQVASVGLIVAGCWLLASRLGATSDANSEQHNRDIMLCLDVSDSMTEIDADLMRAFADIVSGLEGERVGLTIWNSSAIAKFPLTNDYEFILEELRRGADQVDDFDYMGGTNAGEGGSLIGDGVVSCLQRFDHLDKDRARTMILASDNSLDAPPIYTVDEAFAMVREQGVVVFTLHGYDTTEYEQLRSLAAGTGGAGYLLDDASSAGEIVGSIQAQEAARLPGTPQLVVTDQSAIGLTVIAVGLAGWIVVGRRARSWR